MSERGRVKVEVGGLSRKDLGKDFDFILSIERNFLDDLSVRIK